MTEGASMTVEDALRFARMRRADLYREPGFGESWDFETVAEVLADGYERLRDKLANAGVPVVMSYRGVPIDFEPITPTPAEVQR